LMTVHINTYVTRESFPRLLMREESWKGPAAQCRNRRSWSGEL